MRYLFVSVSIISIWIAIILIISTLNYSGMLLPIVALVMTIVLFEIGFGGNK